MKQYYPQAYTACAVPDDKLLFDPISTIVPEFFYQSLPNYKYIKAQLETPFDFNIDRDEIEGKLNLGPREFIYDIKEEKERILIYQGEGKIGTKIKHGRGRYVQISDK